MERVFPESNALPTILSTNLQIPQLHRELIPRESLVKKLDETFHFPITFISAPAGFGKTTLLSQWAAGSHKEKLREYAAWISLENECDLRQFWMYVITALEEIQAGVGKSALDLLEMAQPPVYAILRNLINEISAVPEVFVLILDDYHQVDDPAIHSALTYFVNHLPPNLHLVVASRSQPPLPLARWRANHQLYELREGDLRFTPAEVAAFFNEIKGLDLSLDEIAALGIRTEGWIAGLQLVALSVQGFDEAAKHSFVSAFTGSQRYILDYLVEEVMQRQPEHIKSFLLQTAVLERLCDPLCNAVTGRSDGQAILEHLERANMFTIPLDQERHWYRYHHLFRDVLRHELKRTMPGIEVDLHRRAAAWYVNAGQTEDAIRHACTAHILDQAIELIESVISTAWNRGEIRNIIEWLGSVPPGDLILHPNLMVYYIRALLHGGQMEAAEQKLKEVEAATRSRLGAGSSVDDRLLLGTLCAFRTLIAAVSGEPESALNLGREALSLLPSENMDIRAYTMNSLGMAHYYLGDMSAAIQTLAEGGELARKAGNLFPMLAAAAYQAEAMMCQGQLRQAEKILQQALIRGELPNQTTRAWLPAASYTCVGMGCLLYEWNKLEEAERYLNEAIELGQQLAFGSAPWSAYHILTRLKLARGDKRGALVMIQQAQNYQLTHSLPVFVRWMEATQARAWLALGQLEEVEHWVHTNGVYGKPSPAFVQEFEQITLARLYLLQARPRQVLALFDRIYPMASSSGRNGHGIEILALAALAQQALGESRLAIATLQSALRMAEPEGYLRTFVDEGRPMAALLHQSLARGVMPEYVRRLLGAFPAGDLPGSASVDNSGPSQARPIQDNLIEPLSQRELEVLQLIAYGASNVDIAGELIIATTTAKKHVSNIIQKLGVENRTQAAAKGRHLGLCD
jgi:LuxR family maltose regulon positive regulatory protein